MPAYRTVLAGFHDTETGFRAVETAALVAAEVGAELILVAAYESTAPPGLEKALEKAVARCAEVGAVETSSHTVKGDPAGVLISQVKATGADLLVVGSHRLASLGGRLLGSVPAAVIREAGCDVFIAHTTLERWRRLLTRRRRANPEIHQPTIVVGVHDSTRSQRAAEKATELAVDSDAELILVGAFESPKWDQASATQALGADSFLASQSSSIEESLHDVEAGARSAGVRRVHRQSIKGDAMKVLLRSVDKHDADLLVLGNHQLSGRARSMLDSISAQATRKSPCHVLLVH